MNSSLGLIIEYLEYFVHKIRPVMQFYEEGEGRTSRFGNVKCLFKSYLHILFEYSIMRNKIRIFRNLKMETLDYFVEKKNNEYFN